MLVFFAVVHYLVLPQLAGARTSLRLLVSLNPVIAAAAVGAEAASLVAYAQFSRTLIPGPAQPSLVRILRIQLATLAMSHVLPGGGTAATPLGFRLLRRVGVSGPDASFVLAVQSVGSAAVLNILLLGALVVSIPLRGADTAYLGIASAGTAVSVAVGGALYLLARGSRRTDAGIRAVARRLPFVDAESVSAFLHDMVDRYRQLVADKGLLARAAGWAGLQWLTDAASLWLFLAALGVTPSVYGLLIAFGLANVAAGIPLTPGGLGVYEAVLTSALVAFGLPGAVAVIGVLAYRLFEFWLPIPIGALAYLSAQADDRITDGETTAGETTTAPTATPGALHAAYLESLSGADSPRSWARRRGLTSGPRQRGPAGPR